MNTTESEKNASAPEVPQPKTKRTKKAKAAKKAGMGPRIPEDEGNQCGAGNSARSRFSGGFLGGRAGGSPDGLPGHSPEFLLPKQRFQFLNQCALSLHPILGWRFLPGKHRWVSLHHMGVRLIEMP